MSRPQKIKLRLHIGCRLRHWCSCKDIAPYRVICRSKKESAALRLQPAFMRCAHQVQDGSAWWRSAKQQPLLTDYHVIGHDEARRPRPKRFAGFILRTDQERERFRAAVWGIFNHALINNVHPAWKAAFGATTMK